MCVALVTYHGKLKHAIIVIVAALMRWEGLKESHHNGAKGWGLHAHALYTSRIMATRQPLPRAWHAAVGIGSKLVVWGGDGGSTKIKTRELAVFDVPSLTWEEDPPVVDGSDMPDGLRGMAVTSDGETAYCCGGQTGSSYPCTYYNKLFQITPSRHLCQELEPTSPSHTAPEKSSGSRLVQFGDKLVLYGGYTGHERTNELHVFHTKTSECELWY